MHFLHCFGELYRLKFILERDGEEAAVQFANNLMKSYSSGIKLSKRRQVGNSGAFSHLSIKETFKTPALYSVCTAKLFVRIYSK